MANTTGAPELTTMRVTITSINQAVMEAPIIHIDGAHSIVGHDQIIKINLFQDRLLSGVTLEGETPVERVVCARLVMSLAVAKQLADWLAKNMAGVVVPTEQSE
ncbi:MAG TPA: hypothetical protein VFB16_14075 [Bauldia sp.]|nr:hypothetical protein [Bauldia sp.]